MQALVVNTQTFVPFSSVKIGRFISNIEYPEQGFLDPFPNEEPSTTEQSYFLTTESRSSDGAELTSTLTSIISNTFRKQRGHELTIEPASMKRYSLINSEEWFNRAVGQEDLRKWIEQCVRINAKLYLVVGFITFTDTNIVHAFGSACEVESKAGLPASPLLASLGIVTPVSDLADSEIGATFHKRRETRTQHHIPGETISALEVRRIKRSWVHRRLRIEDTREWRYVESKVRAIHDEKDEDSCSESDSDSDEEEAEDLIRVDPGDPEVEDWDATNVGDYTILTPK